MKKRYIITAAVTAALMAAGAVGGTIAYFTSENKANMSIEAGVVRMSLEASNLKLYSLDLEQQNGQFQNGGLATLQDATVALEKMTPGDRVEFDLTLNNQSNVLAKYQLLYSFVNEQKGVEVNPELDYATAKLSSGLVISMKDAQGQAAPAAMTNIAPGEEMPAYHVSVELPVEAGNEYQGAKSDVEFKLYGVQANMEVEAAVMTYGQLEEAIAEDTSVELLGNIEIPTADAIVLPEGAHINGNGHKIISENRDTNVTDYVFEITGDDVVIENVEVEFEGNSSYMMIKPHSYGFTLKGCKFTSDTKDSGNYATALADNSGEARIAGDIVIEDCEINGFWCVLYGARVNVDNDHDIIIRNTTIHTLYYTLNSHCRDLIVEDSLIRGWTTFNNAGTAKFTNVTFSGSEYGSAEHKYNYLRCYSAAEFTECKFLEDGDHEAGDGNGLLLEVVNGATAKLTNCKVARQNALSTFIDIVADDVTTFDFVTLKMHSTGATNGAGIIVNGVELNAENTPSLVW